MIAYSARTGTRTTLEALRQHDWRILLSCGNGAVLNPHGLPYALDNGVWGYFARGAEWKPEPFLEALGSCGPGADWIVAPDIIGGGLQSLNRSLGWLPRLLEVGPRVLIPVQNGMTPDDLAPYVSQRVGIFIGGTTEWKEEAIIPWGLWARRMGAYCHVGRVNSARRLSLCAAGRVHSFDGSSVARFSKTLRPLDMARRQMALPLGEAA